MSSTHRTDTPQCPHQPSNSGRINLGRRGPLVSALAGNHHPTRRKATGRHMITTARVEPRQVKTELTPASPKGQHCYLFHGVTDNRPAAHQDQRAYDAMLGTPKTVELSTKARRRIPHDTTVSSQTDRLSRRLTTLREYLQSRKGVINDPALSSRDLSVGVKPKG